MTTVVEPTSEDERGLPIWIGGAVVFVLLAGAAAFLLLGSGSFDAFAYSRLVPEVMADPAAHVGRTLRVEGELRQGSIRFRQDPCEWRFVLEQDGSAMPVRFPQCIVPDTFRDGEGLSVTVQGTLGEDGAFLADQVVPRCPSKYEMDEREQAGEGNPHGEPLTGAGAEG